MIRKQLWPPPTPGSLAEKHLHVRKQRRLSARRRESTDRRWEETQQEAESQGRKQFQREPEVKKRKVKLREGAHCV